MQAGSDTSVPNHAVTDLLFLCLLFARCPAVASCPTLRNQITTLKTTPTHVHTIIYLVYWPLSALDFTAWLYRIWARASVDHHVQNVPPNLNYDELDL